MRRFYKEVSILASPLEGEADFSRVQASGKSVGGNDRGDHPSPKSSLRDAQERFRRSAYESTAVLSSTASTLRGRVETFAVLLDGKPIKTPMRKTLAVPVRALADAIAEEWCGQGEKVVPQSMPLTKLANTAIDRVVERESEIIDVMVAYANDLLCYRAEGPDELAARQNENWNPLLEWVAERHGVRLNTAIGISHIKQPEESVAAARAALAEHDAFALTALAQCRDDLRLAGSGAGAGGSPPRRGGSFCALAARRALSSREMGQRCRGGQADRRPGRRA